MGTGIVMNDRPSKREADSHAPFQRGRLIPAAFRCSRKHGDVVPLICKIWACNRTCPVPSGTGHVLFWDGVSGWLDQKSIFSSSQDRNWAMGTRTCSMVSRSRMVTASSPAFSASPTVSKSTVTQYGVPISSWRR